ncbi:MAG: DNA polymerase-3 subunit epsilon [Candidatus Krumholzibacteriia bacterium]|jgi:DNA polymerase-3 subunit epsilon
MQNLHLTRPLAIFDLETTGIDVERDRIVQIAVIRIEPSGEQKTYESLVNPECPIPPEASAVHGISDEDVRNEPTFSQVRQDVEEMFAGADLAGYNSVRFDQPLLTAELKRAGSALDFRGVKHLDAMRIFHQKEKRDLTAAYKMYCGKTLEGAHSALVDTTATLEILDAQLAHYDDLPRDVEALHTYCNPDEGKFVDLKRKFIWTEEGEAAFTFGKYQGQSLQLVVADPRGRGYLEWMLNKDFSEEIKGILREALDGVFPRKEGQ